MLARLLYAAIGLCLLGTVPDRAASTRTAAPAETAAPAPIAPVNAGGRPTNAGIAATPADFAIPPIHR